MLLQVEEWKGYKVSEDELILVDEDSREGLAWYKQFGWRSFLETLLLFLMFFLIVSPMITYVVAIGMFRVSPDKAIVYTLIHLCMGAGVFFVDIVRQVLGTSSKKYNYGFWIENENDFWLMASEISRAEEIPIQQSTNPTSASSLLKFQTFEGKDAYKQLSDYRVYHVVYDNLEKPERLIMVPKEWTLQQALKEHRETMRLRYPIPAQVSYGCYVKLLEIDYEGMRLPVYVLVFSSGMAKYIQEDLPWFNINKATPAEALIGFDKAVGIGLRLKLETTKATLGQVLDAYHHRGDYARFVANESIKDYEQIMNPSKELGMNWFKKYKWYLLLGVGIVAIIILSWRFLIPMFSAKTLKPPV